MIALSSSAVNSAAVGELGATGVTLTDGAFAERAREVGAFAEAGAHGKGIVGAAATAAARVEWLRLSALARLDAVRGWGSGDAMGCV